MENQSSTPGEEVAPADHPDALPPNQERALQAMLTEPTLKAAAAAAGISYETLYRYKKDPVFARRLREAQREMTDLTVTRLQQAAPEAVTVLRNLMKKEDAPPSARISAARTLLDYSLRAGELEELRAQVEALQEYKEEQQRAKEIEETFYRDRVEELEAQLRREREKEQEEGSYIV